jgi:hypothetical protein
MEDYHWTMFTHAMDFLLKHTSLKKLILEKISQVYSMICRQKI